MSMKLFGWLLTSALVIGVVILSTPFQTAYFLFGAVGLYYLFRVAQVPSTSYTHPAMSTADTSGPVCFPSWVLCWSTPAHLSR